MLAHSILHAKESKYINRIMISTDSESYAQVGREYGAEVPFLRPAEFATDEALDIDVFYHALSYLKEEGYVPDVVVQLRPTYPIRNVEDIDAMIAILLKDDSVDSVRSLSPAKEIPYKMWKMADDGRLTPATNEIPEAYNMPRQKLPMIYYQNACIDVIRPKVILQEKSMSGKKIIGYEMKDNFDIDLEVEFARADHVLGMKQGKKRFVFDIDGVIAQISPDLDYSKALPNERMISIVNQLYDWGNEIILFTARGYVTKIDWHPVTLEQMNRWGVKFHELHMGKPNADYYIDDHMLDMNFLYEEFGEK
jgi:CMP-N,N'-diacetyllegionaminic acid synthase